MYVADGLIVEGSERGLVPVTSTTSVDTFPAKWLVLVAFDLPYPTSQLVSL